MIGGGTARLFTSEQAGGINLIAGGGVLLLYRSLDIITAHVHWPQRRFRP